MLNDSSQIISPNCRKIRQKQKSLSGYRWKQASPDTKQRKRKQTGEVNRPHLPSRKGDGRAWTAFCRFQLNYQHHLHCSTNKWGFTSCSHPSRTHGGQNTASPATAAHFWTARGGRGENIKAPTGPYLFWNSPQLNQSCTGHWHAPHTHTLTPHTHAEAHTHTLMHWKTLIKLSPVRIWTLIWYCKRNNLLKVTSDIQQKQYKIYSYL